MKAIWITTLIGGTGLAMAGCFAQEEDEVTPPAEVDLATAGEAIYRTPLEDGNSFTCTACHALSEPANDGFRRPGHPIGDAARRPSYKNGQLTELRDAVNTCVTEWMNGDAWSQSDERWLALSAFLEAQAPEEPAEPVVIQITPPPADLAGGDITAGRDFFNTSCAICHARDADGSFLAPPLKGGRELTLEYVAERVRQSGRIDSPTYEGLTGGIMPFWGADRISDDELRNVAAYINMISREVTVDPEPIDPEPVEPTPGNCTSDHPKVGQVATFRTFFHDVAGQAVVVDDCTIRLENFVFDGTGIDVRLYGATGGNYDDGFAMGENLLRRGGYNGDTLTFTLPEGRTLDDIDGVSIWCVPVGVSFGDGLFQTTGS